MGKEHKSDIVYILGGPSCQFDDGWEGSWFHLWDGGWTRQTDQGNQRGML